MFFVAETNPIAILLGLLIGLVVAFWAFRRRRSPESSASDQNKESRAQETPLP